MPHSYKYRNHKHTDAQIISVILKDDRCLDTRFQGSQVVRNLRAFCYCSLRSLSPNVSIDTRNVDNRASRRRIRAGATPRAETDPLIARRYRQIDRTSSSIQVFYLACRKRESSFTRQLPMEYQTRSEIETDWSLPPNSVCCLPHVCTSSTLVQMRLRASAVAAPTLYRRGWVG